MSAKRLSLGRRDHKCRPRRTHPLQIHDTSRCIDGIFMFPDAQRQAARCGQTCVSVAITLHAPLDERRANSGFVSLERFPRMLARVAGDVAHDRLAPSMRTT